MRNHIYLKDRLESVWQKHFSDIPRLNQIHINFGKKAKRRLASIKALKRADKNSNTLITMTSFFQDERVPEKIIDLTIAHELCHYAHGFASPLPQHARFPHRGNLIDKELAKRGLGDELKIQEKWLKDNWNEIVGEQIFVQRPRRIAQSRRPRSISSEFVRFIRALGL